MIFNDAKKSKEQLNCIMTFFLYRRDFQQVHLQINKQGINMIYQEL